MKPRGELERAIYAATYALTLRDMLTRGYPQSWREDDHVNGIPAGDSARLEEWEDWCALLSVDAGDAAVEMHRKARRKA